MKMANDRTTAEAFKTAAQVSPEEGVAAYLRFAEEFNPDFEITYQQRHLMAEAKLNPETDAEKTAIELAQHDLELGSWIMP